MFLANGLYSYNVILPPHIQALSNIRPTCIRHSSNMKLNGTKRIRYTGLPIECNSFEGKKTDIHFCRTLKRLDMIRDLEAIFIEMHSLN